MHLHDGRSRERLGDAGEAKVGRGRDRWDASSRGTGEIGSLWRLNQNVKRRHRFLYRLFHITSKLGHDLFQALIWRHKTLAIAAISTTHHCDRDRTDQGKTGQMPLSCYASP